MLELANLDAKVLDIRAVSMAKRFKVPVHVRSTFGNTIGTWVVDEEKIMESMLVSGITYSKKEARITVKKVPDQPGIAAKVFLPISDAGILVDMIIQNAHEGGLTDMTYLRQYRQKNTQRKSFRTESDGFKIRSLYGESQIQARSTNAKDSFTLKPHIV